MSKRDQKAKERSRNREPVGPITRRQQVAAIRQVKGQEIAEAVSTKIREAVDQEVEQQLSVIKSTMLDLIDRGVDLEQQLNVDHRRLEDIETYYCNKCGFISDTSKHASCNYLAVKIMTRKGTRCEGDSDDRPERTEAVAVQQDDEVVQGEVVEGSDRSGEDGEEGPKSG